ncbi:MAG TPA: menaquinone biosynthesis protein [Fimbriimonas sp.]
MSRFAVGCVPYLNAKPLVRKFVDEGSASPVKVLYDVPSRLPQMLADGSAQAVMVSSIEAIRHPGMRISGGVSISTQRDVQSVRLFSKMPIEKIRRVAFDLSSMTSNALARIVLKDGYGVEPEGASQPPVLAEMLADHDAAIMIGDNGMRARPHDLYILDLGREWRDLTGLPFVWAAWIGRDGLVPALAYELAEAARYGQRHFDEVVRHAEEETGFTYEECEHYLGQIMDYRLDRRHLAGLAEFSRRLLAHGLIDRAYDPEVVVGLPAD